VAHATCNPSYLGGGDQEDCGSRPAQVNSKTPSQQQKSWVWWCTPVIPATQEALVGGLQFSLAKARPDMKSN
jgi:hypothetical protein